jgi:hypothetical protein
MHISMPLYTDKLCCLVHREGRSGVATHLQSRGMCAASSYEAAGCCRAVDVGWMDGLRMSIFNQQRTGTWRRCHPFVKGVGPH